MTVHARVAAHAAMYPMKYHSVSMFFATSTTKPHVEMRSAINMANFSNTILLVLGSTMRCSMSNSFSSFFCA